MDLSGERRRVVVIGGGVAGSLIAKSLQFHSDLTLVDQYVLTLILSLFLKSHVFYICIGWILANIVFFFFLFFFFGFLVIS